MVAPIHHNIPTIVVSAAIALGLALVTAFWSLADPRAEIQTIKSNYLTLREHEEFVRRFNADILRLEEIEKTQARNTDIGLLKDRIDQMQRQIDLLMSRSLIEPPPNVRSAPR